MLPSLVHCLSYLRVTTKLHSDEGVHKKMLVVIDPFIREFRECCEKYLKGNVLVEHYLFLKAAILNKINGTSGPPLPHFSEAKMARFCSFAPSSFPGGWVGGEWGIIVPFYFVQDCTYALGKLIASRNG